MSQIEGVYREVIEKSEWVAIATAGPDGPHLAGCWTSYALRLGIENDEIIFPAGSYEKTAENLRHDPRVQLLFATGAVARASGQGQGCTVTGTGTLETSGPRADKAKAQFPWARGALVIKVTGLRTHLS
ncbi:MAG: pyridoxamine 5'-phosphate oxidase family protein [Verrucomicrobia bacterium]|jgi:predicted pyridoxine 5'-phosphate oxidase superfamily flavin-nucleotide-binding protein|nr:pyridoxamine 5'-phosphate oxidase family protein [Verrucomicrobiota bacterium]